MTDYEILQLRKQIDEINKKILELLNKRTKLVHKIGEIKEKKDIPKFDPEREAQMLEDIIKINKGPLPDHVVKNIFINIFRSSLYYMELKSKKQRLINRKSDGDVIIEIKGEKIGGTKKTIIAGPCAVESYQQMDSIAKFLSKLGIKFLRGGAYKPRTSPYSFQGLGETGLKILRDIADKYNLIIVTEVMDTRHIDIVEKYADIFQIGARNMHNYELLKAVGERNTPILLKRGFMSTLEEFQLAGEYILLQGNNKIILCERGIRTFEKSTRNTLDISSVPILKNETPFPVIVDISHSTGRRDIAIPIAKASLAVGADGIMVEVHNNPEFARSDSHQQLNLDQFQQLFTEISKLFNI